jgi:hypothetical protein
MHEEGRCRGRRQSPVANLLLRRRCRSSGQQLPMVRLKMASAARRRSATASVAGHWSRWGSINAPSERGGADVPRADTRGVLDEVRRGASGSGDRTDAVEATQGGATGVGVTESPTDGASGESPTIFWRVPSLPVGSLSACARWLEGKVLITCCE